MTDYSSITQRLFTEAQRAVETLDRSRSQAVRQIGTALDAAQRDRRENKERRAPQECNTPTLVAAFEAGWDEVDGEMQNGTKG